MKRKILFISIFFVIVLIVSLVAINHLKHKPKTDRYIKGYIYGNIKEKLRSDFTVKTYDEKGKEVRREKLDIYNLGYFVVEFSDNEKSFFVYESSHSFGALGPGIITWSELFPSLGFEIDEFDKQKMKYVQNTFYKKE